MRFIDRAVAGSMLAEKLTSLKDKNVVVYALPRGGVIPAAIIAVLLHAPLDLVITRKVGHPENSEFALAAINETGDLIEEKKEVSGLDKEWLDKAIMKEQKEIIRRQKTYLSTRERISAQGKTVILVDDGIATGLSIQAAIAQIKRQHPGKILVAVPVISRETAKVLQKEVDELVTLQIPSEALFLGSVGAYYDTFPQVSDEEVIAILAKLDTKRY